MGFRKRLYRNTALLSISALVMRLLGLVWQAWLARRIGAAGLGLFQLVGSVDVLFITLSVSGIRLAAMRLLSEELGQGRPGSIRSVMVRAGGFGLLCGACAMVLCRTLAEPIALSWIGDRRILDSLRLLSWSFPAVGVFAALSGYFAAVGRVWKTAAEQFFEQLLRMGLTWAFLRGVDPGDMAGCCLCLVCADVITDNLSVPVMLLIYGLDRRNTEKSQPGQALTSRFLRLAAPLALSSYAHNAVHTFRQILVPKGLQLAGASAEEALSGYGTISGMVLPLLTFLLCVPASLSEMLVPELTEAQAAGETAALHRSIIRLLKRTLLLSAAAGGVFWAGADLFAGWVYHAPDCARYIRLLAPLMPLLFTDLVLSGILRGLGEMDFTLLATLAEGGAGLLAVWVLLPRSGLNGYAAALYIGESVSFLLLSLRLRRKIKSPPQEG